MQNKITTILFAMLLGLSTLTLSACDNKGPAEKAGENVDNATQNAQDSMDNAGDKMEDSMDNAGDQMQDSMDKSKDKMDDSMSDDSN